jgi:hypothetical protein
VWRGELGVELAQLTELQQQILICCMRNSMSWPPLIHASRYCAPSPELGHGWPKRS